MGFVLTAIGILLFIASLAAIAFGLFMATDPKTREQGRLFALWWVSAAAAASGVMMKDVVTFAVGLLCFLVAGAVFTFGDWGWGQLPASRKGEAKGKEDSEKTTKENRSRKRYGRAAS